MDIYIKIQKGFESHTTAVGVETGPEAYGEEPT